MKSLANLLVHLLQDCGRRSGVPTDRDCITVRDRVAHEGDSFITISLPSFCQSFEQALENRGVVPGSWSSFKKNRAGIPRFLQGFLYRVFDSETGFLLPEPDIDCIRYIRQVCRLCAKVLRPCTSARQAAAVEGYLQCDESVELAPSGRVWERFGLVADIVLDSLGLDDDILSVIVPTHGPGATREHISGNQKWVFRKWHRRLQDAGITYQRFAKGISSEEMPDDVPLVEPWDEEPVRVVFVPKTLKTPRVIAVEPVCMQFAQQGLSRYLVEKIEESPICRGRVNFRDQEINQGLASESSKSGILATLDMSEASDRVSSAHFQRAFQSNPRLRALLDACRSMSAELPTGEVIPLRKFASMGSALCFPVEALIFFISIIASRCSRAGIYPTRAAVARMSRRVYVYGDDLIVPSHEAPAICADLESLGFKVNERKSFWNGRFRESCGLDAYSGERVTPVYLRRDVPTDRGDAAGILSCVATANQLHDAGYWKLATTLRKSVERLIGQLPTVPRDSPAVGWYHDHSEVVPPRRWNRHLQRFEYRCLVPVSPRQEDPLEGEPALAKCFRLIGCESIDLDHLATTPRPYSLALKRRWVAWN